ncbi:hypothetical protein PLCT2_02310 [Planctomycetaceae bacterium]|nr:hypothetical protein PLCT2_02310 [Planctomycetaceae bacterium]
MNLGLGRVVAYKDSTMERIKHVIVGTLGGLVILLTLVSTATGIRPSAMTITPTAFVYLPLVMLQPTPTNTPTPTPTLTNTPTPTRTPTSTPTPTVPPPADLRIVVLSGASAPEYVTIQNYGGVAQSMTDWSLVSVVGPQTFHFPTGYLLTPGATVRIESYNGATNNPPSILFWTSAAIWNNAGDKAELRNSSGNVISSACYAGGCP